MPQAPNVEGLPLWLQILVSLIFLSVTVAVAVQGYKRQPSKTLGEGAQIIGAQIADVGAFRRMADVTVELTKSVDDLTAEIRSLSRTEDDNRHWMRQQNELLTEANRLLRSLMDSRR